MKVDLYTKLTLTVIAGALVGLLVQNTSSNAIAQGGVQKVAICDLEYPDSCAVVLRRDSSGHETLAVTSFAGN